MYGLVQPSLEYGSSAWDPQRPADPTIICSRCCEAQIMYTIILGCVNNCIYLAEGQYNSHSGHEYLVNDIDGSLYVYANIVSEVSEEVHKTRKPAQDEIK